MSQENLPNSVLYAISARIGGIGLDLVAHETIRGIEPFLGKAISYGVRASEHTLIEAWKKLRLPRAELWLAGHPHAEIKPYLVDLPSNVKVLGFKGDVEKSFGPVPFTSFPPLSKGAPKQPTKLRRALLRRSQRGKRATSWWTA